MPLFLFSSFLCFCLKNLLTSCTALQPGFCSYYLIYPILSIQGWLERYFYQRTNGSLIVVYFVAALWHGLYPSFFLFFSAMPLLTSIERLIKLKINPYIVPGYDGYNEETYPNTVVAKAYWWISWFVVMNSINYVGVVIRLSSFERSMAAYGGFYFLPHIVFVVAYLLLLALPTQRSVKSKTSEKMD
jgi:hypothetical protein